MNVEMTVNGKKVKADAALPLLATGRQLYPWGRKCGGEPRTGDPPVAEAESVTGSGRRTPLSWHGEDQPSHQLRLIQLDEVSSTRDQE